MVQLSETPNTLSLGLHAESHLVGKSVRMARPRTTCEDLVNDLRRPGTSSTCLKALRCSHLSVVSTSVIHMCDSNRVIDGFPKTKTGKKIEYRENIMEVKGQKCLLRCQSPKRRSMRFKRFSETAHAVLTVM